MSETEIQKSFYIKPKLLFYKRLAEVLTYLNENLKNLENFAQNFS